jgi:hypothetical protein
MRLAPLLVFTALGLFATALLSRAPGPEPRSVGRLPAPRRSGREGRDAGYVRPAGTREMVTPPDRWDQVDEEVDESFPASDPPSNY